LRPTTHAASEKNGRNRQGDRHLSAPNTVNLIDKLAFDKPAFA